MEAVERFDAIADSPVGSARDGGLHGSFDGLFRRELDQQVSTAGGWFSRRARMVSQCACVAQQVTSGTVVEKGKRYQNGEWDKMWMIVCLGCVCVTFEWKH